MANPIITAAKTYTEVPDVSKFHMHAHENYEIYCFLSGNAKYYVEGNIYHLKPGDILMMKKAEAHSLLINSCVPYERIVINFNLDAILGGCAEEIISFIDSRPLGRCNYYPAAKFNNKNWLYYLEKICFSKDINEQMLYLTVVLKELVSDCPNTVCEQIAGENVGDIIDYINYHLTDNLSLERICKRFYLSKIHLNRKFKGATGSTVWDYILTKRLILAKELLQKGELPTMVFERCGFNDYCTFFRAYKKKFGCSPKNTNK